MEIIDFPNSTFLLIWVHHNLEYRVKERALIISPLACFLHAYYMVGCLSIEGLLL